MRGAAQECRVALTGGRSGKLNNGGEFRVFDRDKWRNTDSQVLEIPLPDPEAHGLESPHALH